MSKKRPDLDGLLSLAILAREDTYQPGWPFGASGEWQCHVEGMLGGATGAFAGAMSPDVAEWLIKRVQKLEKKLGKNSR